jgi:pimeloyl-ACP methyl ester carboxylesterase
MEGRNAMAFSARYPQRVQKLIVVDIGSTSDPRGRERIRREIVEVPEAFDTFDAIVAYMSAQNRYASVEILRRRLLYMTKPLPNVDCQGRRIGYFKPGSGSTDAGSYAQSQSRGNPAVHPYGL